MSLPEDLSSSGKRKRSPDSLVPASILPIPTSRSVVQPGSEHGSPFPKRLRLPPKPPAPPSPLTTDIGHLPSGLLQRIFSYVDPFSLAALVTLNRRFRSLLDEKYFDADEHAVTSVYPTCSPETIWKVSRLRFSPTIPRPLPGQSERSQFLLVFGTTCQFCGRLPSNQPALAEDPWKAGPAQYGVRVIWPFRLRSCGDCLIPKLRKDVDVLLSDASALLPGLPFAFFTQHFDFVSEGVVRSGVPVGVTLQKYYLATDITSLQAELGEATCYGPAATEEWLKGLAGRGHGIRNHTARFERLELQNDMAHMRKSSYIHGPSAPPTSTSSSLIHTLPSRPPQPEIVQSSASNSVLLTSSLPPMPSYGLAPGLETFWKSSDMQMDSMSMDSQYSTSTNRGSKTSQERAKLRAHKKADIIARCKKLVPPIPRDMLETLDAFDAALKVSMPLNESAWELLKQRLLQQRQKLVLAIAATDAIRTAPIPGDFTTTLRTDEYLASHADTPKPEKLRKIAEDFIRQKWGFGGFVTYPNAPQFAAEVLLTTRREFLNEQARLASVQSFTGPVDLNIVQGNQLKLEDMKWIFEQTIKPRTEQIRKDLFLCPICPALGSVKYFAFESIIQHFASKHTDTFSRGSQVVTWKAEWPASPPFSEHPERVPSPSVMQTPTLSHLPLSTISPNSVKIADTHSASWRSSDTMSLVSNANRTNAVPDPAAPRSTHSSAAPGIGMYELQKVDLAAGLRGGSLAISDQLMMPSSLRVYLVIASAVTDFRMRYPNPPNLDLFIDIIETKRELQALADIGDVRCAMCSMEGNSDLRATWILRDLLNHFRESHVYRQRTQRLEWTTDTLLLPDPTTIQYIQSNPSLPSGLRPYLEQAATTSALQAVNMSKYTLDYPRRTSSRLAARDTHPTTGGFASERRATPDDFFQNSNHHNHVDLYDAHARQPSNLLIAYNNHRYDHDLRSPTSLQTRNTGQFSEADINQPYHGADPTCIDQRSSRANDLQSYGSLTRSRGGNSAVSQGQAMTRTNTARSYHGKFEPNQISNADDFLRTIDPHVEHEMSQTRAARPYDLHSQPSTRSDGTALAAASSGSQPPLPVNSHRHDENFRSHVDHARPLAMRREPSRVVEFNEHGIPSIAVGSAYQELSPSRRTIDRGDGVSRTRYAPHSSPSGSRPYDQQYEHRHPPQTTPRLDDRPRPSHPYIVAPYDRQYVQEPRRMYDERTGDWFIAEPNSRVRYVEIRDTEPPQPITTYDSAGRHVQYREVNPRYVSHEPARYVLYADDDDDNDRRYEDVSRA